MRVSDLNSRLAFISVGSGSVEAKRVPIAKAGAARNGCNHAKRGSSKLKPIESEGCGGTYDHQSESDGLLIHAEPAPTSGNRSTFAKIATAPAEVTGSLLAKPLTILKIS
jgi:hypothetical protein